MIFGSWAKPIFLIAFRMVPLLRLPRRESWWMDAEILMLRHQLLAIPVRAAAGPFAAGYKAMDSRESLKVLPARSPFRRGRQKFRDYRDQPGQLLAGIRRYRSKSA